MAAWRELQRYRKQHYLAKHAQMEVVFMEIWSQGNLFCSGTSTPFWKPSPHPDFLTREFANKFHSTRISQPSPSASPAQSSGDTGQGTPMYSALFPQEVLQLANNHADDILQDIFRRLQLDVIQGDSQDEAQASSAACPDDDDPKKAGDLAEGDDLSLPDDMLSPTALQAQAAFWTSF